MRFLPTWHEHLQTNFECSARRSWQTSDNDQNPDSPIAMPNVRPSGTLLDANALTVTSCGLIDSTIALLMISPLSTSSWSICRNGQYVAISPTTRLIEVFEEGGVFVCIIFHFSEQTVCSWQQRQGGQRYLPIEKKRKPRLPRLLSPLLDRGYRYPTIWSNRSHIGCGRSRSRAAGRKIRGKLIRQTNRI